MGTKNTSLLFKKVFASSFFIFGLEWERGWILALENTGFPNSRFEESSETWLP